MFKSFEPTAHLGAMAGLMVFVFGGLGIVFPSPGGMGTFHAMVITALTIYGIHGDDAFSFANIQYFSVQLFGTILLGIVGLIVLPIINKKANLNAPVNPRRHYLRSTTSINLYDLQKRGRKKASVLYSQTDASTFCMQVISNTLKPLHKKGDRLIVAVNDDESVKRLKGEERPINVLNSRTYLLASLSCVDAVCSFTEDTPMNVIEALQPDVLAKGGDYQPEKIVGAKEVLSWGGRMETFLCRRIQHNQT